MKLLSLTMLFLLCGASSLIAQDTKHNSILYSTWIGIQDNPVKFKGFMTELNDSSVELVKYEDLKLYQAGQMNAQQFKISNIDIIMVRKKSRMRNSLISGVLIGTFSGIMLGLMSGDDTHCSTNNDLICVDFTAKEKAMLFGVFFGGCGTLIGAISGAVKLKFPINRDMNNYNQNRDKLETFILN